MNIDMPCEPTLPQEGLYAVVLAGTVIDRFAIPISRENVCPGTNSEFHQPQILASDSFVEQCAP